MGALIPTLAVQPLLPGRPAFAISAAGVIKASPGVLYRVTVITAGSGGSLTLNDCATTAAATASNEIITVPNATLTVGYVLWIDWPCLSGIVVSAVPTSSTLAARYE